MANRLSETERLAREMEIAKLSKMGLTSEEVGQRLGLTGSWVRKILIKLKEDWKRQVNQDVIALRARQAAEIVDLKMKAMDGWDKSLQARTKRYSKTRGKAAVGMASDTEQSLTVEQTNGDPRFLMVYTKLMEREANLLGYDAPKRVVDDSGKVGLKIDLSKLSDEQLEAIASAIGSFESL